MTAQQVELKNLRVLETLRRAQFEVECEPEEGYCSGDEGSEEEAACCADHAIFKIMRILGAAGTSTGQEKTDVYITDDLYRAGVALDVHLGSPLSPGPKIAQLHIEARANCINGTMAVAAKVRDVKLLKAEQAADP